MSTGLVVCSRCKREVHQGVDFGWTHCADGSPICIIDRETTGRHVVQRAAIEYPKTPADVMGPACARDIMAPEERARWRRL